MNGGDALAQAPRCDTVCLVSTALAHSLIGWGPAGSCCWCWRAGWLYRRKGPHPRAIQAVRRVDATTPILWAADEPADHGHGGHGAHVTVEVAQVASGERRDHRYATSPSCPTVTHDQQRPDPPGVTEPGELSVHYPFPIKDLVVLDDALKYGSRDAKARFAVLPRRPRRGHRGHRARDPGQGARPPTTPCCSRCRPTRRSIEVVYGARREGPRHRDRRAARHVRSAWGRCAAATWIDAW